MKTFFSYRREDHAIVHRVQRALADSVPDIVALFLKPLEHQDFLQQMEEEIPHSVNFAFFLGKTPGEYQQKELRTFYQLMTGQKLPTRRLAVVCLCEKCQQDAYFVENFAHIAAYPRIQVSDDEDPDLRAVGIAKDLAQAFAVPWNYIDGLPSDPHLFDYEKDIIQHFNSVRRLFPHGVQATSLESAELNDKDKKIATDIWQKWLKGCPSDWPDVSSRGDSSHPNTLDEGVIGKKRPPGARVLVTALNSADGLNNYPFTFPEAGPREMLYFRPDHLLRVGILVSGGIAPGINAVIDGIAQRHWLYAKQHAVGRPHPGVVIYGLRDGFLSKGRKEHSVMLRADKQQPTAGWNGEVFDTPDHAHEGGSILGTSRVGALLHAGNRIDLFKRIDDHLLNSGIDILYLIGGDGSMKAAHALHQISRDNPNRIEQKKMLSVVAIPKTMDNDILWMWQSFGFLSAVEKAREVTEHLSTETQSNPRLCVVQLFGSDSGFVVSHTVLASATGHCNAALIPEVKFSMKGLITHLRRVLDNPDGRPPHGIIVMAETAIPTDALEYIRDPKIALTEDEVGEIERFSRMRNVKRRIEGQTEDALRSAGLKIVSRGLLNYLPERDPARSEQLSWELLRVVTNEPRHQLRSIPPSCLDIILGQRLGTLAVDNAVAGYTDFMISQWLTEYVLVPLKLVVLGRKRIPETGIFWKSVLDKTGQPADMVSARTASV